MHTHTHTHNHTHKRTAASEPTRRDATHVLLLAVGYNYVDITKPPVRARWWLGHLIRYATNVRAIPQVELRTKSWV